MDNPHAHHEQNANRMQVLQKYICGLLLAWSNARAASFHKAVALARGDVPDQALLVAATPNTHEARGFRCTWVRDNADIVAFLHALRVELQVHLVMQHVVPCTDAEPFLYRLRFGWGTNGNPHAHGQRYVLGNPSFESVVED